jgi:uncharacterized membrane protein
MAERRGALTAEEARRSADRVAFFSDAVFAIAITLLVLGVRVPAGLSDRGFDQALGALAPDLLAFLLSFFLIALYWSKHHRAFGVIVRADGMLVFLNFLFLLFLVFLPFPTSLLSEYATRPEVLLIYAGTNLGAASLSALVWLYAWRGHRLVPAEFDLRVAAEGTARAMVLPAGFLLSLPLALFAPPEVSWILWALLVPLAGVAGRAYRSRSRRGGLKE